MSPLHVLGVLLAMAAPPDTDTRTVIVGGEDRAADCYEAARRGEGSLAAVAACDEAIEGAAFAINRTASRVNRGVVHYNGARYAEAVADFSGVIDAGTASARVLVNRGLAYEQMGRNERRYDALAAADYARALERQPRNRVARRRLDELAKPVLERTPLARRIVV